MEEIFTCHNTTVARGTP